ncbi:MAG: FtsW/RodA/SpoVE family cell cycle protein [Oscillospiraceae bacterium]|nr:FtsW/RodA/SpoVE family cell cycle protein [Oscillospiraceae bacterium]
MRKLFDAVHSYARESDMLLLVISLICSVFGVVLISSATRVYGGGTQVAVQILAIFLGVAAYIVTSLIDIDILADKYKLLFILGALFICTLFIWGVEDDTGNKAWLRFFGIGVQPAEVVKLVYIIIIARLISERRDRRELNSPGSILRIVGVFLAYFALLILSSRDLGSALVYAFILAVVMFIGGVYLRWFALAGGALAAAAPLIWTRALTEKQQLRIRVMFDPMADPTGLETMWQANQSKTAISAGRFLGQGLYKGRMTQSDLIPQQHTDFIFSAAGEEFGFVGCAVIILLLMILVGRCLYVGVKSNSSLGLLVCTGVAATLVFQTLENVGMCLGLTPVIGLTLPFFSYGGSSVVSTFIAIGLVSGIKMRPKPTRYRNM